jgi:isopenicillin N synthase-like dioxygenase
LLVVTYTSVRDRCSPLEDVISHTHTHTHTPSLVFNRYIASIYAYARRAHALPPDVKRRYHPAYTGPDIDKPELAYAAGSVSTVRGWDYSRTRFTQEASDATAPRYPPASVLDPPYAEVLDTLYENQNKLSELLLVGLAETLELPSETLKGMFSGPDRSGDFGTIRLLHYPGSPQLSAAERERANVGISAHTDFEAFTLMHQVN